MSVLLYEPYPDIPLSPNLPTLPQELWDQVWYELCGERVLISLESEKWIPVNPALSKFTREYHSPLGLRICRRSRQETLRYYTSIRVWTQPKMEPRKCRICYASPSLDTFVMQNDSGMRLALNLAWQSEALLDMFKTVRNLEVHQGYYVPKRKNWKVKIGSAVFGDMRCQRWRIIAKSALHYWLTGHHKTFKWLRWLRDVMLFFPGLERALVVFTPVKFGDDLINEMEAAGKLQVDGYFKYWKDAKERRSIPDVIVRFDEEREEESVAIEAESPSWRRRKLVRGSKIVNDELL